MTAKPVVPRALALRDVEAAIDHYAAEAGRDIALRFINALGDAYRVIASRPATGSTRYAHELDLPGLRHRRIARFPYLIFYVDRPAHIDVWRVLHTSRDIPAWLTGDP